MHNQAALILVDIQNDFLPGGALACYEADGILPGVQALVKRQLFACHIATQDWHPANHISFVTQHEGKQAFESIRLYEQAQTLWPVHCVQGSHGAALAQGIDWDKMDLILRKGCRVDVDSYSAFQENYGPDGERPSTGLAGYLKERGITSVYIAGLARDVCVLWTAQDAKSHGFHTTIIWDLCAPVTPASDETVRQTCRDLGIGIVLSDDL
ncbi:nicotinamidase [Pelistega suis]|uniref:nicotinamidase n=1 Tax=Pelistega suis TaxID=1631957 RepID=A0A849P9I5_9BURK|nr:nicotinamidase [Pelistega suis]NOL52178.1 nicotinamidase [Pelistega suis]